MSRYFKAKIISNLPLNSKNNLLTIKPLETTIDPEPGQFYMIEPADSYDPLLKRPFSFFRKTSEGIQFLYTIKGKGTSLMRDFKVGEVIHIIGPLGIGYPKPEDGYIPLLIAGGIGIASLFTFAELLSKKAYLLYGAKCKDDLLMLDELKGLGHELIFCTDDCSCGKAGTVVDILNDFLTQNSSFITRSLLYACGPQPMLKALSKLALEKGIKGYVSVEENMACGVGACQGCVVKVRRQKAESRRQELKYAIRNPESEITYKRVCKEGPVFPIEEIVW